MTVKYFIPLNSKGEFSIYDLAGRKTVSFPINGESNQLNISEKDLHEGIYFYNVIANDKELNHGKIIVIK